MECLRPGRRDAPTRLGSRSSNFSIERVAACTCVVLTCSTERRFWISNLTCRASRQTSYGAAGWSKRKLAVQNNREDNHRNTLTGTYSPEHTHRKREANENQAGHSSFLRLAHSECRCTGYEERIFQDFRRHSDSLSRRGE